MSETTIGRPRRLFVNGEALRVDVEAPRPGGGQKFEPQTPEEARTLLLPQVTRAIQVAESLPDALRLSDRVYVEARLLPNYIAPSYFPGDLLNLLGAVSVGSRADAALYRTSTKTQKEATRRIVLSVPDDGLDRLADLMRSRGQKRTEQQAFEEIRRLDLVEVPEHARVVAVSNEVEMATWEAVLHPTAATGAGRRPLDPRELDRWYALVENVGGRVVRDYVRQVGGLTFAPVLATRSAVDRIAAFNAMRVIRRMPAIPPRPRLGLRSSTRIAPPSTPQPVLTYPTVAVFDGGLDESRAANSVIPAVAKDLTPEPVDDSIHHGTGVTAATVFGLVNPGDTLAQPPLPVTSYRVFPTPDSPDVVPAYWVLDQIKDVVESTRPQIVNLSLGPEEAVEDDQEPNRWTAELDQLAWDNDVLFVVAAGNDGEADRGLGLHRVQVPADMANGLSVGACDKPAPDGGWARAPYSSMGPGRAGNRIQPVGVQFGGVNDRMFPILRADGSFMEATGTSFAAPVTTHAVADLVTRLPRANPSILRAFTVHFSQRHRAYKKMRDEVGHGRQPLSFTEHLDTGPGQVDVLFVDSIARGNLIGYNLPIPPRAVGRYKVRMTLAFASPVEPTEPTEYTSASLDLVLRPHMSMYSLRPPKDVTANSQTLDIRGGEARALISQGWTLSQEPVTKSTDSRMGARVPEAELRDGGKWETIRRFEFTIAADELEDPRIELSYVSRRSGGLDRSPTEVPFALLLSVIDQAGDSDLYEQTAQQFAALRAVSRVHGQVRLRGTTSTPRWY